jgi:hypothetical protein
MNTKLRSNTAKGERKANSKLIEQQVKEIIGDQRPQKDLAVIYGVSRSRISMIKSRKQWKHIV